jgi:hypothetical protein
MKGISYLTNENGRKTALVVDLKTYKNQIEDFLDGLEAESRKNEATIPYQEVRNRLIQLGKLEK